MLPEAFKKLYSKVRGITDCTEVFLETLSSLEIGALLWSNYKHHHTFFQIFSHNTKWSNIVGVKLFGGRTSDVHIFRNSGFLEILDPI